MVERLLAAPLQLYFEYEYFEYELVLILSTTCRSAAGPAAGRQPARAHASNKTRRAHQARSQNSDGACTHSVGFMHARVDGRPRMRWYGVDCQDAARPPIALRNL